MSSCLNSETAIWQWTEATLFLKQNLCFCPVTPSCCLNRFCTWLVCDHVCVQLHIHVHAGKGSNLGIIPQALSSSKCVHVCVSVCLCVSMRAVTGSPWSRSDCDPPAASAGNPVQSSPLRHLFSFSAFFKQGIPLRPRAPQGSQGLCPVLSRHPSADISPDEGLQVHTSHVHVWLFTDA